MPPLSSGAGGRAVPRPVPGLLAAAERHLRVGAPADLADAVTRSHLDDGRCVGWYGPPAPGWQVAVDAERADAPVPPALARRFGTGDFWARWTRAECCCKLADVPVAVWWRRHGLGAPAAGSAVWRTLRLADLVLTVGFAPTLPPRDLALSDAESRLTRLSSGQ
ncbi:hypothetical protein OG992_10735 [Micromonospora sp. NBC_00362]|uniref:hypothetical protein n=1 Tax=Micromonospora sp. NBC_00362 TaxID=2975975 RepID=UPI002254D851|nr:hypothetical protein [Micromonospora sp. NBC_00362]MCX5117655.1 hypothetical protein [Micromonospora sp. NBC_00362]